MLDQQPHAGCERPSGSPQHAPCHSLNNRRKPRRSSAGATSGRNVHRKLQIWQTQVPQCLTRRRSVRRTAPASMFFWREANTALREGEGSEQQGVVGGCCQLPGSTTGFCDKLPPSAACQLNQDNPEPVLQFSRAPADWNQRSCLAGNTSNPQDHTPTQPPPHHPTTHPAPAG